jgi:hypothetical protein
MPRNKSSSVRLGQQGGGCKRKTLRAKVLGGSQKFFWDTLQLFSSFLRGASCPKSPRVAATAASSFILDTHTFVKYQKPIHVNSASVICRRRRFVATARGPNVLPPARSPVAGTSPPRDRISTIFPAEHLEDPEVIQRYPDFLAFVRAFGRNLDEAVNAVADGCVGQQHPERRAATSPEGLLVRVTPSRMYCHKCTLKRRAC